MMHSVCGLGGRVLERAPITDDTLVVSALCAATKNGFPSRLSKWLPPYISRFFQAFSLNLGVRIEPDVVFFMFFRVLSFARSDADVVFLVFVNSGSVAVEWDMR
jgi:hypothetical protein